MSTQNAASICYIMKNAAFAAGDSLTEKKDRHEACQLLIGQLLTAWFSGQNGDVVILADGLTTPMMACRNESGFALNGFSRGIESYDGPCFAVGSSGGIMAYERGLFDLCVSAAYLEKRNALAAVVYDPLHVELFHSVSNMGAYLNGKSIAPAHTKRMSDACVSFDHAALRARGEAVRSLLAEAANIRVGAACGLELCYTACGRTDAAIRRNEAFFDCAAGLLMAQEAGAVITDGCGGAYAPFAEYGERRGLAVACGGIAEDLAQRLGTI